MSAPFNVQPTTDQGVASPFDSAGALAFLRQHFPTSTPAHVAAATGMPLGTVEGWFKGRARPNADALAMLACCFGPRFLAAALPARPAWLERALLAEGIGAIEQAVSDLRRELDTLEAAACRALTQGHGLPPTALSAAAQAGPARSSRR